MTGNDSIRRIVQEILDARSVVAFTGAGISTESGIPDFRSPGGVWSKYTPVMYDDFRASRDARVRYWRMKYEGHQDFHDAQPNAAHLALARLERIGKLHSLITQNIDGLHQDAGHHQDRIIELHGTARFVNCLACGKRYPADEIMARIGAGEEDPPCASCGGMMKPATISFGQAMPQEKVQAATDASRKCDVFLAIGSSLVVQPACLMPELAKESGAFLVIINLEPTSCDSIADVVLHEKAGVVVRDIVDSVTHALKGN